MDKTLTVVILKKNVLNSSFQGIKRLFVLAFNNAYGEC